MYYLLSWFSRRAHLAIEQSSMVRQGVNPLCNPLTNLYRLVKFGKPNLRAKATWLYIIFQLKRLVEVMGVQPLLVLHIVQVKNCKMINTAKSKITQKNQVLNLQKSMPLIIQILSYSIVKNFGTKLKNQNVEKMLYLQENLRLHFQVS